MQKIDIKITGTAAELTLGNYMPTDPTIMNNWEDFYHYNDLIHNSQLLADYITSFEIKIDGVLNYTGKIPAAHFRKQKCFSPVMMQRALYLRTECAEQAVYECTFETENFDKSNLFFETQDYDLLFKIGKDFISKLRYEDEELILEWISGKSIGNICLLYRFENGYLIPIYDAINKKEAL